MKKLLIGVMAAVFCCFMISAPVFAEIKVGGMVSAEQFYWDISKERRAGAANSVKTANQTYGNWDDYGSVEFAMGQPWNRLNVQYISDDKKIGGFLELRTGGQKGAGNANNENNFVWELAYIDWHFNPNFYLRVGRQTQTFAIYSPEQQMGHNHGHIVLSGFGNIHGGTSRDGIRAYIKFNDMVRMEIEALNPDSDGTAAAPGTLGELTAARTALNGTANGLPAVPGLAAGAGGPGGNAREENTIPRFDISLPIKFANFSIEPSFSWARSEYAQANSGSDDSYDSWGAALGFKAGFGPFTISGEYTYGENLGGHTYVGAGNGAPMTYNPGTITNGIADVRIEDTRTHSAWMQAEFNFGPFAIQGIVGYENAKNDGDPAIARDIAEFKIESWAYGMQFPIYIAKNFKVVPQVWYYDYGDDSEIGGAAGTAQRTGTNTDLGSEVVAGVFWQLTF